MLRNSYRITIYAFESELRSNLPLRPRNKLRERKQVYTYAQSVLYVQTKQDVYLSPTVK